MKTTIRFETAITKLYNAFHKGELDAMDCQHCAVGNLCNNSNEWVNTSFRSQWGKSNRINTFNNKTGYSRKELAIIEALFIFGVKSPETKKQLFNNVISAYHIKNKSFTKEEQLELQFKGLCAVVEYLCELDNIPNVMDVQSLFEINTTKKVEEIITIDCK